MNVYKPKGVTSFSIVYKIRKSLGVKKVGHAGTLDPLAEGVLIVLTDKDTKRQDEFMHMDKEYVADIGFGIHTDCLDLEQIPEVSQSKIKSDTIKNILPEIIKTFLGVQNQEAPIYSAKKQKGKSLYKIARAGNIQDITPKVSPVTIHEIEILEIYEASVNTSSGMHFCPAVKLRIKCSSGTYIRSLARDIAKKFGTDGILLGLKRTKIGAYSIEISTTV